MSLRARASPFQHRSGRRQQSTHAGTTCTTTGRWVILEGSRGRSCALPPTSQLTLLFHPARWHPPPSLTHSHPESRGTKLPREEPASVWRPPQKHPRSVRRDQEPVRTDLHSPRRCPTGNDRGFAFYDPTSPTTPPSMLPRPLSQPGGCTHTPQEKGNGKS